MNRPWTNWLSIAALLAAPLAACGGNSSGEVELAVRYHNGTSRLRVVMSRELAGGEHLHAQLRRGGVGELDCQAMATGIPDIGDRLLGGTEEPTYEGPVVPPEAFETVYNTTEWLTGDPTPEMLAEAMLGGWIVDVCLMDGGQVVRQLEVDISRTTDSAGSDGKFDGDGDEQITSVGAYAATCVAEMGEIPFFEKIGEGDYLTANCLDGTPIPTEVTQPDGTVLRPTERTGGHEEFGGYYYYDECDHKQFIYNSCEPNAVDGVSNGPRVQSASNEQGTHWVLLCRKAQEAEGQYYDIAMIGTNPYTGKTCFFQNALGSRMDGEHVPHPGDTESSSQSPETWEHIWQGLHGGIGFGIQCAECHSTDAFIHSEWITRALDDQGRPVVPRMGVHEDFALGFNDGPYDIVARDRVCSGGRCGWDMPRHLTSPQAAACTRCHRIGEDIWSQSWLNRMEPNADGTGTNDENWNSNTGDSSLSAHGRTFEAYAFMPPDLEGVDAQSWHDSEYGRAVDFIQMCARSPSNPECQWEPLPTEPNSDFGELPQIELEGRDLAMEAAKILGARVFDPSDPRCTGEDGLCATRRCAECHSVSPNGLEHWHELTQRAESTCNLDRLDALAFEEDPVLGTFDGVSFTQGEAQRTLAFVNDASEAQLGEAGIRSDARATIVAERPFPTMADLAGVSGIGEATMRSIKEFVNQGVETPEPVTQAEAMAMIDCMREAPEDPTSVFEAARMGIFVAGAQYGLFQELFRRAYGDDAYLVEYLRFKSRVTMPKGNHPKLSQREFATVLEWFQQGLPNLRDVVDEPPRPTTCTENLTPALQTHIDEMQFEGWEAVNADNGIRMYGCDGAATGRACLSANPDRTADWGNSVGTIRELRPLDFRTSFWTRSSADGRFIGNGGSSVPGYSSTITDLLRDVNIGIQASYDPGFFPDNSGFIFQGSGAGLCAQSLLETANTVDFSESQCVKATGINLYQHVARGLNGGDYFVINSQFTSDSGGTGRMNPRATWGASATMKFTPMVFNGSTYEQLDPVIVDSPYEGDSVLSPSGRVVISRLSGPDGNGMGYVLRRVQATQFGSDYIINIDQELATVCMEGTKANISFDERFFVTHVYDGTTANIWIVDLRDGSRHQVTNMPAGHVALFPHFRSDGWFYFLVRNDEGNQRWMAASDAALMLRGE